MTLIVSLLICAVVLFAAAGYFIGRRDGFAAGHQVGYREGYNEAYLRSARK
jgi:hypothetical protein